MFSKIDRACDSSFISAFAFVDLVLDQITEAVTWPVTLANHLRTTSLHWHFFGSFIGWI